LTKNKQIAKVKTTVTANKSYGKVYKVLMTEKAVKALQIIPKADVDKFMRKIAVIAKNPYASLSYVKRLKNSQNFRFRFGIIAEYIM